MFTDFKIGDRVRAVKDSGYKTIFCDDAGTPVFRVGEVGVIVGESTWLVQGHDSERWHVEWENQETPVADGIWYARPSEIEVV